MTRPIEYGLFLPVGSGGWIASSNAPPIDGTYNYNREVALLSEALGFDFTLSQAVWRGYGGPSRHFQDNLESLTTTAGLGEATERIGVWSTVNTLMVHPVVASKMVVTNDQISGGRTGLNIVAGGNRASESQMGLGTGMDKATRYRRAAEWVEVAKALWTEECVDYDGEFFQLRDCQSSPKPPGGPPTMICAATSDAGLAFVAEHLDGVLFEATTRDGVVEIGQRARRISGENGGRSRSYCVFMVVPGETDADAQRRLDHYHSGRDLVALSRMADEWGPAYQGPAIDGRQGRGQAVVTTSTGTGTVCGSPETIVQQLVDMIEHAHLDSVVFMVPDFIGDLRVIGEEVLPALGRAGFAPAGQAEASSTRPPTTRTSAGA